MRLLRSAAFNAIMFGACAYLSFRVRLTMSLKNGDAIFAAGALWARITMRALERCCNIGVRLQNPELLPSGPAIIAAQHQSAFDTMFWLTVLPRPAYVLKQELVNIPVFGPLLPASGFIAVDRKAGARALRKMVAEAQTAIARGRQIVIFPEGTRVAYGSRGTIQPGILALARALKLPVIAATTDSGRYWGKNAFAKTPGTISVKLHPPLQGTARDLLGEIEALYYQ